MDRRIPCLLLLVAGCPGPAAERAVDRAPVPPTDPSTQPRAVAPASPPIVAATPETISATVVRAPGDVPPLRTGFAVHLVDVGLGLAVLVRGPGFSLLYDGGSADDLRSIGSGENHNRLIAYLWAALGPSGPAECTPSSVDDPRIDRPPLPIGHVVLSHPHQDHTNFLDEVLRCYAVGHVWDVGVISHSAFYESFVAAIAAEPGVAYHTVATVPDDRRVRIRGRSITMPDAVVWTTFAEGHTERLDEDARFLVLHADAAAHDDFNDNSLVLRVELGATSLLLTGDAEAGPRRSPDAPLGGVEQHLVDHHRAAIDVDVFLVDDHGSSAANRVAFLEAVSPTWAMLSAGPRRYGRVGYPDEVAVEAVLALLAAADHPLPPSERLLRTDTNDRAGCPVADRIGPDDAAPGGCDNHVLTIGDAALNR